MMTATAESLDNAFDLLVQEIQNLIDRCNALAAESELLGLAEVAEMTGLSRSHLGYKLNKNQFPEPFARLAMGPVWKKSQIEAWYARWPKAALPRLG